MSVEQAIVNLLLNAIEAASADAVTSPVESKNRQAHVRVATRRIEGLAEVVVSDNGSGPSEGQDV